MKKKMRKRGVVIFSILICLALLVNLAGAELSVEKVNKAPVIILELDNPAIFDLIINNPRGPEEVQVYSLVGVNIFPKLPFKIGGGNTTQEIKVYVPKEARKSPGFFRFEYQIKGDNSGIFSDTLSVKIVPLSEALSFSSEHLRADDSSGIVVVKNTQEAYLSNISVHFKSQFFDEIKEISLNPSEAAEVKLPINRGKVKTLKAGPYIFKADVKYDGVESKFEGVVNYLEKNSVLVSSTSRGFIIRKNSVTKSNEGNVQTSVTIDEKKDIISRLFTIHSIEPSRTERKGFFVYYTWERELAPAESFSVASTTNYTMPVLILLFIIIITIFVSFLVRTNVVLDKRVSFVRTKGGEFALKVHLHIKAEKYVENIQVIDRLPGMTILYEKFGIKPDVIDNANRKLTWKIQRLNAGEERVFSYIVYSKIKVVGRFELPSALTIFERDGKIQEVSSNRAFFVADTLRGSF